MEKNNSARKKRVRSEQGESLSSQPKRAKLKEAVVVRPCVAVTDKEDHIPRKCSRCTSMALVGFTLCQYHREYNNKCSKKSRTKKQKQVEKQHSILDAAVEDSWSQALAADAAKPELKPISLVLQGDNVAVLTERDDILVHGVITSPPYNLGHNVLRRKRGHTYGTLYENYKDNMDAKDYLDWMTRLFSIFEKRVIDTGCVLFVMSYGVQQPSLPFRLVCAVEDRTDWQLADVIHWKKPKALPMGASKTHVTRNVEFVFVFCRKGKDKSFITNKRTVGASPRGQPLYEVQFNFLTAPNNDERNRPTLAKQKNMRASFSTDLVTQLLERYFPVGSTVLDPHCGEGTTGIACIKANRRCVLIDIDPVCVEVTNHALAPLVANLQ